MAYVNFGDDGAWEPADAYDPWSDPQWQAQQPAPQQSAFQAPQQEQRSPTVYNEPAQQPYQSPYANFNPATAPTYTYSPNNGYDAAGNYQPGNRAPVGPQYAPAQTPAPQQSQPQQSSGMSYNGGDPLAWMQSQWGSMAPTSSSLEQLYEALRRAGVNVQRPTRAGGAFSDDKLTINGTMYDFIRDVGGPGAAWQMMVDGGGGSAPAGGGAPSGGGFSGPNPGGYTDPSSMLYLQEVMNRLNQMRQPQDTQIYDLMKSLALQRVEGLKQKPYTQGEEAALVTQYRDPLTLARDTAKQNKAEELSRRGITPTSGLFHSEMGKIDQAYTRGIAMGSNDLAVRAVDQNRRNQDQQLEILMQLLGVENMTSDRRDNRSMQAVNTAQLFPQFDENRFDMLMRASNEGASNPNALMGNMAAMQSLQNNQNQFNAGQQQDSASMWGQILGYILEQM